MNNSDLLNLICHRFSLRVTSHKNKERYKTSSVVQHMPLDNFGRVNMAWYTLTIDDSIELYALLHQLSTQL